MAQALHARALAPLARQAHAIAARAWLAAGDAPRAAAQARALLALADAVDPWTDEPAFAWAEAAALLRAAGEGAEAAAALAAGRAWLAQAAAPLAESGERRAWLEGVPLHRLLRAAAEKV